MVAAVAQEWTYIWICFILATKERRLVTQLGLHVGTQFVSFLAVILVIVLQ